MSASMRIALPCAFLLAAGLIQNAAAVTLPAFERSTLDNGAELILMEKRDVPLVALEISVRGGALADAAGKEGSASLLADLLTKGAGGRDAKRFAEAIDGVGGRLSVAAGMEAVTLSAEFLARDRARMVELAADALLRPTLDDGELDKVRTRAIRRIAASKDGDPSGLIGTYAASWLFGDHPYGRSVDGSESSLTRIGTDDIKAHYANQLGGDRLIIVAVGDFDAATLRSELTAAFSGWRKAKEAAPSPALATRQTGRRVLLVDKPGATQTYFWLGNVGVARKDDNLAAQTVVNTLFGGRFTSMLNTALRIDSGLSYGARSTLQRRTQPGAVSIGSFTRTEATVEAIDLAIAQLEKLHSNGLDEAALGSARSYLLGQFPPTLETHTQLAGRLAEIALHGLGREDVDGYAAAIAAVGKPQIGAAIGVYPASSDLVMVLIGDAGKLRESVAKYGPVTELPLVAPTFSAVR